MSIGTLIAEPAITALNQRVDHVRELLQAEVRRIEDVYKIRLAHLEARVRHLEEDRR